uniref:Uncharacterized protein n=1 Tax=Hyaloperonospora arabidopsidis (strain Emoy2) TaxID=559515 RepID=M4BET4_HYAAE
MTQESSIYNATTSWQTMDKKGPHRESNPGPLAPEARIIPLDHEATLVTGTRHIVWTH